MAAGTPSARRLAVALTRDEVALDRLCSDASYHARAARMCELLDWFDGIADPATAASVADEAARHLIAAAGAGGFPLAG
jgi:hypothetical protein